MNKQVIGLALAALLAVAVPVAAEDAPPSDGHDQPRSDTECSGNSTCEAPSDSTTDQQGDEPPEDSIYVNVNVGGCTPVTLHGGTPRLSRPHENPVLGIASVYPECILRRL